MIPAALLLRAYAAGYFPMPVPDGEIGWFSPDPRGVLPLDAFHTPSRLTRTIRARGLEVRIDSDFEGTIRGCASRVDDEGNWINGEIIESYIALHELGFGHSVETWQNGRLVGGLYGVALGGAFFGESMFNTVSDASKVALSALVERLRARGYALLDIQWLTPFLASFGAIEIPRDAYLRQLEHALRRSCTFV